jgi:hypothetical protein
MNRGGPPSPTNRPGRPGRPTQASICASDASAATPSDRRQVGDALGALASHQVERDLVGVGLGQFLDQPHRQPGEPITTAILGGAAILGADARRTMSWPAPAALPRPVAVQSPPGGPDTIMPAMSPPETSPNQPRARTKPQGTARRRPRRSPIASPIANPTATRLQTRAMHGRLAPEHDPPPTSQGRGHVTALSRSLRRRSWPWGTSVQALGHGDRC